VSRQPILDVVLRTCSRVHALSPRPRMAGLQKVDVVQRCLRSLGRSMTMVPGHQELLRLTVIDDASDPEHVASWQAILRDLGLVATWIRTDSRSGATSFHAAIEAVRSVQPRAVYFVEDDYLHYQAAVERLLQAYDVLQMVTPRGEVAITPYDCPDRYTRTPYPSSIRFAVDRYWRTVRHTTGTFMISGATLQRHWELYTKFGQYGIDPQVNEDTTINLVYSQIPCFSPIPTLAIHLQYQETLPLLLPAGSWRELWDQMHC
jgi:hypothetical protein